MKRNNSSNGQKYQEAGPQLVTGHKHSAGLEVGGLSVSGLRHLNTPQLFSLPCEGRNHGQHVPKARAALRIKPLAFCLVRHRIWEQVLEAKGLCESRLSYLTSCPTLQKCPLCGFFICEGKAKPPWQDEGKSREAENGTCRVQYHFN